MLRGWTTRYQALAVTLAAGMACGDDGSSAMETSAPTTTVTPGSESSPSDPTSSEMTTTPVTTGDDPTDGPPTTATDDSADSGDSTGDEPEPTEVCPDPPFADSPLPSPMASASPIAGTSLGLYPGGLVEGPVWIDGALYLSHFGPGPEPSASILRYTPGGALEEHIAGTGSNGLAVDARGFIVATTHDDGGLSRFGLDGTRSAIVTEFEGNRFNSPNDLTLRSDGTIYFTDPNWQATNPNPQPVHGIYRVSPDGTVSLEDGGQNLPNGITLSPDESLLYVGTPGGVLRYEVGADGALVTPPTPFAPGLGLNSVDGMALDCAGNLYVSLHSQGQVRVVAPDQSELGTITIAPSVTNVAFGGPQRRTLYATAGDPNNGDSVYSIELEIPGYPY